MYEIQNRIEDYLGDKGARALMEETGVGSGTIYSIKDGYKNKKYTKQTLDTLYEFFGLEEDEFYKERIKGYTGKESALGALFKIKREKLGLTKHEVAKIIKGTERHLTRIETGDFSYRINSYYLKELIRLYKFSEEEANLVLSYVLSLGDIISLVKKEDLSLSLEPKCP